MPRRIFWWSVAIAMVCVVAVVNTHRREKATAVHLAANFGPTIQQLGCDGANATVLPDGLVSLTDGTAPSLSSGLPRSIGSWHCSDERGRHPSLVQLIRGVPGDPYEPVRTIVPISSAFAVLGIKAQSGSLTLTAVRAASKGQPGSWDWLGDAWTLNYRFDAEDQPSAATPVLIGDPCGSADLASSVWVPWPQAMTLQSSAAQLRFVNVAGRTCVLTGYPSVTAIGSGWGQRARETIRGTFGGIFSDPDPPVLILAAEAPATAVLESIAGRCPTASLLEVTAPGAERTTDLSMAMPTCQLQVHPVTAQLFGPTG